MNLNEACINAADLIYERTIDIARLIKMSDVKK
jgi:glycerate kinase